MMINPELLTAAERLQYDGYLRREEINTTIMASTRDSLAIKEIVRRTGYGRGLVRRILRGERSDVFRVREARWEATSPGSTNNGRAAATMAPKSGVV